MDCPGSSHDYVKGLVDAICTGYQIKNDGVALPEGCGGTELPGKQKTLGRKEGRTTLRIIEFHCCCTGWVEKRIILARHRKSN